MKRIKAKKKFSFFTLAVLLLSLVLVSRAASCIEDLRYGFFYSTSYSAQDYQYALQYKEYPYLNRICRRDTSSSSDPFIQVFQITMKRRFFIMLMTTQKITPQLKPNCSV